MANPLVLENVWLQQQKFEDAHSLYARLQAGTAGVPSAQKASGTLAGDIAAVRQDIQKALSGGLPVSSGGAGDSGVYQRLEALEKENKELRKITDDLRALILNVQASVAGGKPAAAPAAPAKAAAPADDDSDDELDDDDLFGDDSDDEASKQLKEKRLAEYAEKKSKKPGPIAKSNVILDVKPWDDETDLAEMEKLCRSIEMDGLLWGQALLKPIGYGINKLTINCVVEDDKISIEELSEKIEAFEDYVQSVDVAAFNKI